MNPTRIQTNAVGRFSCLGPECPDTCCQGWGMQLTPETIALYKAKAPELLDAVTSGEAEFIMKRDPATDACVKFEDGWCGIHKQYGDALLGDACHFYPRITRALGSTIVTAAALSCPETARLMLYAEDGLGLTPREEVRVPFSMRNYLPEGLDEQAALQVHEQFIAMVLDESVSAERALMRVGTVARALALQPVASWTEAMTLYVTLADGRLPNPQPQPADLFNLVHMLHGLAGATPRALLGAIIERLSSALGITFDGQGGMALAPDAATLAVRLISNAQAQREQMQPILHRYLAAQLSGALFPFSGFGPTLPARTTMIGVRFALVKWALATLGATPSQEQIITTIHVLSRFTDHLADPTLSLAICDETGWNSEARLRALVGDAP